MRIKQSLRVPANYIPGIVQELRHDLPYEPDWILDSVTLDVVSKTLYVEGKHRQSGERFIWSHTPWCPAWNGARREAYKHGAQYFLDARYVFTDETKLSICRHETHDEACNREFNRKPPASFLESKQAKRFIEKHDGILA